MSTISPRAARLAAVFAAEEQHGLRLAVRLRLVAVAAIALWLPIETPYPEVLYVELFALAFALTGLVPLALPAGSRAAAAARYLGPALDAGIVTAAALLPNPLAADPPFPAPLRLRFGNDVYLFVLVVIAVFTYAPRLVLWTGTVTALVWSGGVLWVLGQPDALGFPSRAVWQALSFDEKLRLLLDPRLVLEGQWGRTVVLLLIASGVLAAAVRRSRQLVIRQAEAERQRTNLSRYFSPNLVDELARTDVSFRTTRTQDVAVLFADVVGFTAFTAHQPPSAVIALLRAFHARMQQAVFDHGGTLDKYVGDGVMATFGTPEPGPDDATRALACARAMVTAVAAWSAERVGRGEPALRIGVGVHCGPAVLGDVGGPQRLEFAVVGDTVNVASRLERLTRQLGVTLVASAAVVEAARREGAAPEVLAGLRPAPPQPVRGRAGELALWVGA